MQRPPAGLPSFAAAAGHLWGSFVYEHGHSALYMVQNGGAQC